MESDEYEPSTSSPTPGQDAATKGTPSPQRLSVEHPQRSPTTTELGLSKSRREITPHHLLKKFSRISTPEEYVSPNGIPSSASLKSLSANDISMISNGSKNDDPFTTNASLPNSTLTSPSHIPIIKSRINYLPNSSAYSTPTVGVTAPGSNSRIQLPSLHRGEDDSVHTPMMGIGGMVSTVVDDEEDDDDILESAQPRTSIPQPTHLPVPDHQSLLAEGNSGGYYPAQGRPIFDFSIILADDGGEGIEETNADEAIGGRNVLDEVAPNTEPSNNGNSKPAESLYTGIPELQHTDNSNEQKGLDSLRAKLGSILTKKVSTPSKGSSSTSNQDLADDIYLEVREALKELKEVVRDLKRKQEMAMIETETVKDGLYELVVARKQLEEVQTSMDDVQEAIKLADMEFARHRKTLEERTKEDNELEEKLLEMDKETLRLNQVIDDRRKEQQELQSRKPPPLFIRVIRELDEIRYNFSSLLGLLVLFLFAEILFVYILMLSRREELDARMSSMSAKGGRDIESHGVWIIPLVKSIVDGAASLFFSESRDITPI